MEKYNSNAQEILLKILELSESSAPVTLSLGHVSVDNCCRAGIVIKEAPSSVIQAIVSDKRIFTAHLEYDGLHISTKPL